MLHLECAIRKNYAKLHDLNQVSKRGLRPRAQGGPRRPVARTDTEFYAAAGLAVKRIFSNFVIVKKTGKIIILLFAAVAVLAGASVWAAWSYASTKYEYEATRVEIPAGGDMRAILCDALGKSFGNKVATLWERQNGSVARAHGSYLVEPGTTAYSLSRTLLQGRQTPVKLTYNNLRTFGELAARIGEVLEIDSADFVAACDSILPAAGFKKREYAAAFLPDTYEFYWTASAGSVAGRLLEYRNSFWNDERRAKAAALGITPVQTATLASIVEEETNKADERGKVARLYLNRVDKGMKLQADPTVKFAVGDFSLRRITAQHLRTDSPYNTYLYAGLPPGPVRIAEKSTIDAVLNAPAHDYLYMCAKSDFSGYHDFAKDYDRHRINAARYHNALNRRGIR